MWWRMGAGAVVGVVVGAFVPPGYALWTIVGIAGGYALDAWLKRQRNRQKQPSADN